MTTRDDLGAGALWAAAVPDRDVPGREVRGYVVEGASPRVRARLGLAGPVWSPLLDADLLPEGGPPFRLPDGVVGAGCGLAFVLGRSFPGADEPLARGRLADALVTCHLSIQVVGPASDRRGPGTAPRDAQPASVGEVPVVACRLGPAISGWRDRDLAAVDLLASLDGNVVARGERDRHPLDAALWLAQVLDARERLLDAGQIVVTGSRTGLLQVLPGQTLAVRGGVMGGALGVDLSFA